MAYGSYGSNGYIARARYGPKSYLENPFEKGTPDYSAWQWEWFCADSAIEEIHPTQKNKGIHMSFSPSQGKCSTPEWEKICNEILQPSPPLDI